MARRPNGCRVKIHRNYEIAEIAALSGKQRHTVQRWIALAFQPRTPRVPSSSAVKIFVHFCRRANRSNRSVGRGNSTACAAGRLDGQRYMAEYRPAPPCVGCCPHLPDM